MIDEAARNHLGSAAAAPSILSFWHHQLPTCTLFIRRWALRRGQPVTVLVSQSRDGDLAARVCERWRLSVVRGSASRGGQQAMRQLHRVLSRDARAVVSIPDGPQGPKHVFKPGTIVLAQLSGAPILPLAFAVRRPIELGSWDRMEVPRPFSRIAVRVGAPIEVPRALSGEALEEHRRAGEGRLQELRREAERLVGARVQRLSRG